MSARVELARLIHRGLPPRLTPRTCTECQDALATADAILASGWLADAVRDAASDRQPLTVPSES